MFNKKTFIKKLDKIINDSNSALSIEQIEELKELREEVLKSKSDAAALKWVFEILRLLGFVWDYILRHH
jgi:hypothetical protein